MYWAWTNMGFSSKNTGQHGVVLPLVISMTYNDTCTTWSVFPCWISTKDKQRVLFLWIISLKMYNMEFSSIGPDPYPWTWTTRSLLLLYHIPENQHDGFFHWYIAEHEQHRVFFLWFIIYIHIPEQNMRIFSPPLDYIPEHVQCGVFVPSLNVSNMELSAIRIDPWPWTPWCFLQLD